MKYLQKGWKKNIQWERDERRSRAQNWWCCSWGESKYKSSPDFPPLAERGHPSTSTHTLKAQLSCAGAKCQHLLPCSLPASNQTRAPPVMGDLPQWGWTSPVLHWGFSFWAQVRREQRRKGAPPHPVFTASCNQAALARPPAPPALWCHSRAWPRDGCMSMTRLGQEKRRVGNRTAKPHPGKGEGRHSAFG